MSVLAQIRKLLLLAKANGLQVHTMNDTHDGAHQIQVAGDYLRVNWWPYSKNRTAYVLGTNRSVKHADASRVVALASEKPATITKVKRSQNRARRFKRRAFVKSPNGIKCRWCPTICHPETATVDHVIPLKRGGLDNYNNMAIACDPCNRARGHDMPEIEQGEKQ